MLKTLQMHISTRFLCVPWSSIIVELNVRSLMPAWSSALTRNVIDLLDSWMIRSHTAGMLQWGLISTDGSAGSLWKVNCCWHRGSFLQGALKGDTSEQCSKRSALETLTLLRRSRWLLLIPWRWTAPLYSPRPVMVPMLLLYISFSAPLYVRDVLADMNQCVHQGLFETASVFFFLNITSECRQQTWNVSTLIRDLTWINTHFSGRLLCVWVRTLFINTFWHNVDVSGLTVWLGAGSLLPGGSELCLFPLTVFIFAFITRCFLFV